MLREFSRSRVVDFPTRLLSLRKGGGGIEIDGDAPAADDDDDASASDDDDDGSKDD